MSGAMAQTHQRGQQLMGLVEIPHPVLRDGTDLLTEIPHPRRADLRTDATREGPADSQPGPGAGRTVQGGRSPARSAAAGALDRPTQPAHSTSGRPRPPSPTATKWGTKSSPGEIHEVASQPVDEDELVLRTGSYRPFPRPCHQARLMLLVP